MASSSRWEARTGHVLLADSKIESVVRIPNGMRVRSSGCTSYVNCKCIIGRVSPNRHYETRQGTYEKRPAWGHASLRETKCWTTHDITAFACSFFVKRVTLLRGTSTIINCDCVTCFIIDGSLCLRSCNNSCSGEMLCIQSYKALRDRSFTSYLLCTSM